MSFPESKYAHGYIKKSDPAVERSFAIELWNDRNEASIKTQHAQSDINEAHKQLDAMGVPRMQPNGLFPLSLVGRLRTFQLTGASHAE